MRGVTSRPLALVLAATVLAACHGLPGSPDRRAAVERLARDVDADRAWVAARLAEAASYRRYLAALYLSLPADHRQRLVLADLHDTVAGAADRLDAALARLDSVNADVTAEIAGVPGAFGDLAGLGRSAEAAYREARGANAEVRAAVERLDALRLAAVPAPAGGGR